MSSIEVIINPANDGVSELLKLATQHSYDNRWDLAIEVLLQAKEKMVASPRHHTIGDWLKLPLYLSRCGRFVEANAALDWLLADAPRRARQECCIDDPTVFFGRRTSKESLYQGTIRNIKAEVDLARAKIEKRMCKKSSVSPCNLNPESCH